MGYMKIDCPVCGNENPINTKFNYHKCLFCKRNIYVKMRKQKNGKVHILNVEENLNRAAMSQVAVDSMNK